MIFISTLLFGVAPDVLVVCPESWRDAASDWVAYRESQGRTIALVAPEDSAEATLSAIKKACPKPPTWLLLVGDAAAESELASREQTPTWFVEAEVNRRWGSEPTLATDTPYGDWNDDGQPEVAVGRLAFDSAAELRDYIARVIAYESRLAGDLGDNRLTVVASPGRFSPMLDRMIEATALRAFGQLTPASCGLHFTYADWRSPYCPFPPAMPDAVLAGLERRSLAWVYMGHAHRHTLDVLHTPVGYSRLLDNDLAASLRRDRGPAVAAIIACYAGAFDGDKDCLGEHLLRQPGGPLAVLAGSRVTMPYGNSVLGVEVLGDLFDSPLTLGEQTAAAKRRALRTSDEALLSDDTAKDQRDNLRQAIELIATGFLLTESDRRIERREHVQMYNLLGDPLLRLRRPAAMAVSATVDERRVTLRGRSPLAGDCRVRVERPLMAGRNLRSTRKEFQVTAAMQNEFAESYRQANRRVLAERKAPIEKGAFQTTVELPKESKGEHRVVVEVVGPEGLAVGHATIEVTESEPVAPNP